MADVAIDLPALDRDVRRAAARVEQLQGWLALGTTAARDQARSFDPFDGTQLRHTGAQSTYRALVALEPSILDVPLRDGLVRWVHELLQARVGHDLAIDDADAENVLDSRLTVAQVAELARSAAAAAAAGALAAPDERGSVAHTYREAFASSVRASNDARGAGALARAGELAAPVAAVRKERRERRFEAARRLGLAHPFALASKADVGALAKTLLDASEPLAVELFKQARKTSDGAWRASSAIQLALGHGAREGWPAHLGQRWLDEAFNAIAPRGVEIGPLREPIGSASFLRAAMRWGYAWRTSGTPRTMPFGLARDPYPVPARRFGFAIASVIAEPSFQRRSLELPSRTAIKQARVLRTTMFLHARLLAARALLAAEERVTPSLFEEMGARVFGAPLPAAMRDAWPDPRASEPAQLLGLLGTQAFLRDLVHRFDDDWFRNPRAGKHLTSLACGPAFDLEPLADNAPETLARAFEEALG